MFIQAFCINLPAEYALACVCTCAFACACASAFMRAFNQRWLASDTVSAQAATCKDEQFGGGRIEEKEFRFLL